MSPLIVLGLLVTLASGGYVTAREAGVRRGLALGIFLLAWAIAVALLQTEAPPGHRQASLLADLAGSWIPFVAAGWMHHNLEDDPWSPLQRVAAAAGVGILTLPVVAIAILYASCRLELGCI